MNSNIQAKERARCKFCVNSFDKKLHIFSASDLPRASHWNSTGLRLPDKLACPRKRWAEPGNAATEIVPLSGA